MSFWNSLKSVLPFLAPVVGAAGGSYLGGLTDIAGAQTIGGALGGAAGGAAGAAADKRNPVTGAVLGGVGGALYPNIGDIISSVTGGAAPTGISTGDAPAGAAVARTASTAGGAVPVAGSAAAPSVISGASVAPWDAPGLDDATRQLLAEQSMLGGGGSLPGGGGLPNALADAVAKTAANTNAPLISGANVTKGTIVPPGTGATEPSLVQQAAKFLGFDSPGAAVGKLALPAASIAYSAMQANKPIPYQAELQGSADQLRAASQANLNGQVPQATQVDLQRRAASEKAAIRSRFASMNMSGSTSELTALRSVDQRMAAERQHIVDGLMATGLQQAGAANQTYAALASQQLKQDAELSDAIAAAAAAAARPSIQLKVA